MYSDRVSDHDWPEYRPYGEDEAEKVREFRLRYAALVTMCDEYLGKILDLFDAQDLWKDTALIVNTDHGFMLGEKGFVGKNYPPVYDELANIPFFFHHPAYAALDGTRCAALAQTPDIAPTVPDVFGFSAGRHMTGQSMMRLLEGRESIHEGGNTRV